MDDLNPPRRGGGLFSALNYHQVATADASESLELRLDDFLLDPDERESDLEPGARARLWLVFVVGDVRAAKSSAVESVISPSPEPLSEAPEDRLLDLRGLLRSRLLLIVPVTLYVVPARRGTQPAVATSEATRIRCWPVRVRLQGALGSAASSFCLNCRHAIPQVAVSDVRVPSAGDEAGAHARLMLPVEGSSRPAEAPTSVRSIPAFLMFGSIHLKKQKNRTKKRIRMCRYRTLPGVACH
jgi:hypothetical protein